MNLSGNLFDYFKAFLGGVGVSFTPCIYPLIPVVIGCIGAKAVNIRLRGFLLSFVYVSGMAITYAILGAIASLAGGIFFKLTFSPIPFFLAGALILIFGLSMLGLFPLPQINLFRSASVKEGNYFSVLLLGLTSGLVASPCLAPALGSLLTFVSLKKNLLYGAGMLLSFAYGMGLILIIAGTSSAMLIGLPKPGRWMDYVKKAGGLILIFIGVYFIFMGVRRI